MRVVGLLASLLSLFTWAAKAEVVTPGLELRIAPSNLVIDANTAFVSPGETITLGADMWMIGQSCQAPTGCAQKVNSDHFLWSSDDRPDKICDPFQMVKCKAETEFTVTHDGVQFLVPNPMPERITLTVKDRDRDFAGTLFLARKTVVVSTPTTSATASRIIVLRQSGHWVKIDGLSYWVPYGYRSNWVPYQHGYWAWISGQGWNWISYDPWGYYTDHYGFWRLHASYGWVWQPFAYPVYHPAVVTFFYTNGAVGWSPYYSGYPQGYRSGVAAGFRDGFGARQGPSAPIPGSTVVAMKNFYAKDISQVKANMRTVSGTYIAARKQNGIGPQPGLSDPMGSRQWIQSRVAGPVPETQMQTTRENGGEVSQPLPIHPVPVRYTQAPKPAPARKPASTSKSQAKHPKRKKKKAHHKKPQT
jgi:hypothetical protein